MSKILTISRAQLSLNSRLLHRQPHSPTFTRTSTNFHTTLAHSTTIPRNSRSLAHHPIPNHLSPDVSTHHHLERPLQDPPVQTGKRGPSNSGTLREDEVGESRGHGCERSVRPHPFNASPSLTTCSPTGWHGESGAATHGGHLTVRFKKADGSHFKTQHVYPTEPAYERG